MTLPVIFDCDPGHDDAIALLMAFASSKFDIQVVTITGGNQTLAKTVRNAKRILSFAKITGPILAAGRDKPLFRELEIAPQVHGDSGLDGPYLPESDYPLDPRPAIEVMKAYLEKSVEPMTIIATGPLTNIGLLLMTYPKLKSKIKQISLMGGSIVGGNWTPSAEFNILVDPEAAQIVFRSGIPIFMAGLDVTHLALVMPEDTERIRLLGTKVAVMVAELLDFFAKFHLSMSFLGTPLHDPVAVAYLIDPTLFKTKDYYVEIDTQGEFTLGSTVADVNHRYDKKANVTVLLDVDRARFIELIVQLMASYA